MKNTLWFKAAGIRAVKTMAQSALAVLGSGMFGVLEVDWLNLLSITIMAGICSVLTSIAGLPEVKDEVAQ
ncbi:MULTISPECIES: holin [Allobaculum]|uniref:holin n=1 Tax=Allobaculum TaxID=174708 RepID=UPI001E4BCB2C|nr:MULTISPECIES: holin [Allobaculum]UNT92249.1 holin [Allobaculum sp. Allo2]